MNRPITIKDIAAHVGVSSTTVSAVLGRTPSGHVRVSEAMRARILEAAQQMNYRPNSVARSLRYQKTNVLGVYSAYGYLNPYVAFTSFILGGVHLGCDENRKDLLLHGMYQDRQAEEVYAELADGRIDGLVLYTAPHDPLVKLLAESSLPVIAIVDALPGIPSVIVDDAMGSRLLAAHLAEKGHKRVCYRAGLPSLMSAVHRHRAFYEEATRYGLEITESHPHSALDHERLDASDLTWLNLPHNQRPTAIACWNDLTAFNLLHHCRQRNLRVPEDLAVVGFDGIPPPRPTPWHLTTIQAPWVEVARTAVNLLVRHLDGSTLPSVTVLPVALSPGDTT